MSDIRVLIADDHPVVLSGLETVLRQEPGFAVVAKCSDSDSVLPSVLRTKPDVVLLDLHMPNKNGLEIMREINEGAPGTRIVLLTGEVTEEEAIEALRLGVCGILLKEMAPRLLRECIRKVHAGGQWLEKASIGRVVDKILRREEASQEFNSVLTKRELEVMRLAVQNLSNEQIAGRLYIAPGTAKIHVHSIYKKLRISGRAELARIAKEKGLI